MGQTIYFVLFQTNFIKVRPVARVFLQSLQGNVRILPQSEHGHFLSNLQTFHVIL